MNEQNREYILNLNTYDVPWHRLTTPYGRATDFPNYFETLVKMDNIKAVKGAVSELTTNTEHQSTLWHASPFAMIFLARILEQALAESENNNAAHFIADELLDFFVLILECFHDVDEMEHADPLPLFSDLLNEEYLWSEEYDEEEDEMRYEEEDVFPDDLFYSFYYHSYEAILAYKFVFDKENPKEFQKKIDTILDLLR